MLSDIKRDCINTARLLGDYQSISVEDLLNNYCEATDLDKGAERDKYLSAIILRFWYTIDKLFIKSQNTGLTREDFFSWLVEAIEYACKYRAWKDPEKKVSAQACVNQCIETIRLQHYYEFNLNKHKINYNIASLDATVDEADSAGKITILDTLADDTPGNNFTSQEHAKSFIQQYINNNKLVEAIILDNIAFNDVEKQTKQTIKHVDAEGNKTKYVRVSSEFWPYRLVQILNDLPDNYLNYFLSTYKVSPKSLKAAISAVKEANNQKLYRYLRATLKDARVTAQSLV